MRKVTKEEHAALVNKVIEYMQSDAEIGKLYERMFAHCCGMFMGEEVCYEDVYVAVMRAILAVRATLEEMTDERKA